MESISVSVRVRPLNRSESADGAGLAWRIDGNTIAPRDASTSSQRYTLDHVFGPEWTTQQVYKATAHSLIHKVVSGFNGTVFAYGQTSSGKTFSMRGSASEPGLIPLAVGEVFELIEQCEDREFLLRVSYMELYNEEVNDLLAPANVKLPIHENKENGVYVVGLREDIVTSAEQVLSLLDEGEANRHIGSTKMNDQSSRSHTVFRMVVESRGVDQVVEADTAGAILVSTLTLVDLAGSERVAKTGAEGIRMKEGTAINKSLLTLGNVINKLSEGAQGAGGHIPYRDSKLTRILQPSLGGNAKTAIICAMTPAGCHSEESHSTLRFACRAKRVMNNAVVNEVLSDAAVLKRQAKEIEELKKILASSGGNADFTGQVGQLRAQLLHSEQEKELMRITLQGEKEEREKAQKQAEVAKKLMLEQQRPSASDPDAPRGRNSRRETWCPGDRAGWDLPGAASASSIEGSSRKRPLRRGAADSEGSDGERSGAGGGTAERERSSGGGGGLRRRERRSGGGGRRTGGMMGAKGLPLLEEGDDEEGEFDDIDERDDAVSGLGDGLMSGRSEEEEEEADARHADGSTPQRPRRERNSAPAAQVDAGLSLAETAMPELVVDLNHALEVASGMTRTVLECLLQRWHATELGRRAAEADVAEAIQTAAQAQADLSAAEERLAGMSHERDTSLVPQLEQLRWQARQHDRKTEEVQEAHRVAAAERDAVAAELEAALASAAEQEAALQAKVHSLIEQRAECRETIKALNVDLTDARGQIELQAAEKLILDAREKSGQVVLQEVEARLKDKVAELDASHKALEESQERQKEAEVRARELQECNKRLEGHVQDLESRKRAPLYQKKQEEELRASLEKAAEAEARALEAEARMKELKSACDTAERRAQELEEALEKLSRQSADALSQATERHGLEVQRLGLERAKMQAAHDDALQAAQAVLQESQEAAASLRSTCEARDAQLAALEGAIAELRQQAVEMQAAHAETEACAQAAAEQVSHLEGRLSEAQVVAEAVAAATAEAAAATAAATAEATAAAAAEHAAQLTAAAQEHQQALAAATEVHAQAVAALQGELAAAHQAAAASVAALQQQLQDARDKTATLMQASMEGEQAAAATIKQLQAQVDQLTARVAEAAGALKAKEELRDERQRHKQESAALRTELQKLQLESKSGSKGKELTQKELENARKRLQEVEAKLKVAMQEKTQAVAAKAELDRQLRQTSSKQVIMEKSLEKSAVIENKKRESMMVNLTKSKEQLNSTEERLKQLTVDVQKAAMDLVAKTSECQGLEDQLAEAEAAGRGLQEDNGRLQVELLNTQSALECLTLERDELAGSSAAHAARVESLSEDAASLQAAHGALQVAHEAATQELLEQKQAHTTLAAAHSALTAANATLDTELHEWQCKAAAAAAEASELSQQLTAARAEVEATLEKLFQARASLPEVEELQRQLTATNLELMDVTSTMGEVQATAVARQVELQVQQVTHAEQLRQHAAVVAELKAAALFAAQREADLAGRALESEELCTVLQGRTAELTSEVSRLSGEASRLQRALDATAERHQDALAAADVAHREAVAAAEAAHRGQMQQLQEAHATLAASAEAQLQLARQGEADQRREAARLEVQMQELQSTMLSLEVEVEQLRDVAAAAPTSVTAADNGASASDDLQQQVQQAAAQSLLQQVEASGQAQKLAEAEVEQLKSQLSAILDEMNDLQSRWDRDRAVAAQHEQELQAALASAQHTTQQAAERADRAAGEAADEAAAVAQDAPRLQEATLATAQLQDELRHKEREVAELRGEVVRLQDAVGQADGSSRQQQARLEAAERAMHDVQAQLAAAEQRHLELQERLQEAERGRVELRLQLDAAVEAQQEAQQARLEAAGQGQQELAAQLREAEQGQLELRVQVEEAELTQQELRRQLQEAEQCQLELRVQLEDAALNQLELRKELELSQEKLSTQLEGSEASQQALRAQLQAAEERFQQAAAAAAQAAAAAAQAPLPDDAAVRGMPAVDVEVTSPGCHISRQDTTGINAAASEAEASADHPLLVAELEQRVLEAKEAFRHAEEERLALANQIAQDPSPAHIAALTRHIEQLQGHMDVLLPERDELERRLGAAEREGQRLVDLVAQLELQRDQLLRMMDDLSTSTQVLAAPGGTPQAVQPEARNESSDEVIAALTAELQATRAALLSLEAQQESMHAAALPPTAAASDQASDVEQQLAETLARLNRSMAERDMDARNAALHSVQLEGALAQQRSLADALQRRLAELGALQPPPPPSAATANISAVATPVAGVEAEGNTSSWPKSVLMTEGKRLGFTSPTPPPTSVARSGRPDGTGVRGVVGAVGGAMGGAGAREEDALLLEELAALREERARMAVALENAASAKTQAVSRLEARLTDTQALSERLQQQLSELQQQHEALTVEADSRQRALDQAQAALSAAQHADAGRAQAAELSGAETAAALARLADEHEGLQRSHAALLGQHEALTTDASALRAALGEEASRCRDAQASASEQGGHLAALQEQLDTARSALLAADSAKGQLEQQLRAAQASLLSAGSESLQATETAARQLTELRERERLLAAQLTEAEAATQAALGRVQELERANARLDEQVRELRGAASGAAADGRQLAALRTQLQEALGDNARLEAQLGELGAQAAELQARLADRSQLATLQGALDAAEANRAQLAGKLAELRAAHDQAQAYAAGLASQLASTHERLHAEVCRREQLEGAASEQEQALHAQVEEAQMLVRDKEAEMNARMMTLHSQIHWLTEQNAQLQRTAAEAGGTSGAAATAAATEALSARLSPLEADLRSSRRAEQKLSALLFRLRQDVKEWGGDVTVAALEHLKDVRSKEYDVDAYTNKLKRYERQMQQLDVDKAALQKRVSALEAQLAAAAGGTAHTQHLAGAYAAAASGTSQTPLAQIRCQPLVTPLHTAATSAVAAGQQQLPLASSGNYLQAAVRGAVGDVGRKVAGQPQQAGQVGGAVVQREDKENMPRPAR